MKRCLLLLVLSVLSGQVWAFHPNDVCSSALLLTIPSTGSMSTTGAGTDPLLPCSDATPQNGVWFSVVGDGTTLRFFNCGNANSGNISIQVFSGSCGSLACVGGNDDTYCAVDASSAEVTWCSSLGTVYFIHLGGETGNIFTSNYFLSSLGPCNYFGGNCVPQYVLAPATVNGTTFHRDDCCFSDGADMHYAVQLPYASSWKFIVCGHSGPWNTLHVSTSFCGTELCSVSEDSPFQTPTNGCGPFYALCPCAARAAGLYHITIDSESDDGVGGPHKLVVVDCNWINNPNIVALDPVNLPSSCELLFENEPLTVIVQGDNLNLNEPPLVMVSGGCDNICTGGGTPATWHFDEGSWMLEEGMPGVPGFETPFWHNTIVGLTEGSVCLALEGFLGVELASFTALPSVGEVILNWETESEQDLSSFKLYRDDEMIVSLPASNNATGERYVYRDRNVVNEHMYAYTLYAEEMNGELTRLATASATPHAYPEIVGGFALMQNYPNPFNPETTIEFSINEPGNVLLRVFDLNGREVAMLVNGSMSDGVHSVKLDATSLASGIYFYRLEHKGLSLSKKMVLMK